MSLTGRNPARRRRTTPDEKLPQRPGESTSSARVMAPTRMKLRARRRDNAAGGAGAAAGGAQPEEEEEERRRESGGRSSRRKNTNNASTAAATASSSPPSSSSASARAVMAAEEASPDSKCPICLDRFNNLAYLDRCLHRFCFPCIQEWSHNKAECPLCKQPFASILHSVRAEDDFKEYTLRPAPANSSVAATVAMVAAMASAARSDHQMRLMLRRHRAADGGETTARRRRRERGGRGGRAGEGAGVWEWYLDSPPLALPPLPHHPVVAPVVAEDSEEGEDLEEPRMRGGADLAERGVIFEGLTGLGGAAVPVAPNDRASRRLMTRLVARQRLQREGGTVRRLRERETVAFRRALYRSGIRVRGIAGFSNQGRQQQRDITAESFRRNPTHLNRLRPWLRRELTVLYGAHGSLVDIVQRIITARLARHGLEDTPTIEEELQPFLLARTDHFLHELVSFARSPLSLENYDLQAVYEPPAAALELDGTISSTDSSSVIAISEGEEEERRVGGRAEERLLGSAAGAYDDVVQTGSCLSLSAWDDETPGPSYSSAEPSCSLAPLSFSPAQEAANEEAGEKRGEEGEEECLIVGYKKPIAERTPELVQLSSDSEEEKKKEEEAAGKLPPLASTTPLLSFLPTIPPSTSGAYRDEQEDYLKEKDGEACGRDSRARSWSGSSGRSRNSVCTLGPAAAAAPAESERQSRREKRRRRRKRGRDKSGEQVRKSGTLSNPNRSIYPAMMRHLSHSPFHSSVESGSPPLPSPPDSSWEYRCSQVSPLTSSPSRSSSSSSSPLCSSPRPSSQTPPSLSPGRRGNTHHGEKPGGKRKYKSRHLDSDDKDPTWRPSSSHSREKRPRLGEKERRRRGRQRRKSGGDDGSRRCREDRSPSVEIIYEGPVTSNATRGPVRRRRRKRHRQTQHSSSPVIITLDSDSNHDNGSSSSSPLSSQQTVDFSDLPPLPLVHSAAVGGALNAEIGELPVDILDRASDGSDTEPAGPIAIDNSDNSDRDVDVENVDGSGSPLRSDDTKGPMRAADSKAAREAGTVTSATTTDLVRKRDSEVSTSDSRLLATILNDLKEITVPKCDLSMNFERSCSPDTRTKHCGDQREVSRARPNQDVRSAETRHPRPSLPEQRQSNAIGDQNPGSDLPTLRSSIPSPPPLERLKECRVREQGEDVPPLLKHATPVRSYNRSMPPPLKHKDAGSPHPPPISPIDLHSPHASVDADPVGVHSHVAAISPIDSHSTAPSKVGALTIAIDSMSHKPPLDCHSSSWSENSFTSAECLPHLNFNSFHSSKLDSGRDRTMEISSAPRYSPVDLHPVNSSSPIDFHSAKSGWSKDRPAHSDSTSRGCSNKTLSPNSWRVAAIDLHPSSSVSAEGTPAASDVFSGANCNDASPPVFVSSIDSRTQNPSSPIDSHSCSKRENLSAGLSPTSVGSAPSGRLSPIDVHPRSSQTIVDLRPCSAASEGLTDNKALPLVNNEDRLPPGYLPPIDLHCTGPVPPTNTHSSSFVGTMIDQHLNHTALSSSNFQTSRRKCISQSEPTLESHAKPRNHFGPSSHPHFPVDARSKHNLPVEARRESQPPADSPSSPRDFQLPADNHVPAPAHAAETQRDSNSPVNAHSDSRSPADERSARSVWDTHTAT